VLNAHNAKFDRARATATPPYLVFERVERTDQRRAHAPHHDALATRTSALALCQVGISCLALSILCQVGIITLVHSTVELSASVQVTESGRAKDGARAGRLGGAGECRAAIAANLVVLGATQRGEQRAGGRAEQGVEGRGR
jgi:hypothetical protein